MRHPRTMRLSLVFLCALLWQGLLLSCQTSVTSNGVPVENPALIAAARTVDVAELAMEALNDALTAQYESGRIPGAILAQYDQAIVPKVQSAFLAARLALTAWAQAPGHPAPVSMGVALGAVQQELGNLRAFYMNHAPRGAGAAP